MSETFNPEIAAYIGSPEQLADARMSVLSEGPGRGSRIISFRNGTGLAFTVTPDRGMDLVDCSFRGIPLVFRPPMGYAHPNRYEPQGAGWLRNWQAGLMTTVGLRNTGPANGEFGQHGRISNQAAEDVGIRRGVSEAGYRLEAVGTLRECRMFGENLELRRSISTGYGDNAITLRDEVTNHAFEDDYLQLLYHCRNGATFGFARQLLGGHAHHFPHVFRAGSSHFGNNLFQGRLQFSGRHLLGKVSLDLMIVLRKNLQ